MLLDLPRVEYHDKDKKRVKKSDLEFVKAKNKQKSEADAQKGLTLAEIMGQK